MLSSKMTYMTGLNMVETIRFEGKIRLGRGNAEIGVEVSPETILALAEALKHNEHVGHAVWHVQNPENEMPCSSCHKKEEQPA